DQIKSFEESRTLKATEMADIMEKSAETGETLDAEQAERYDTLETEVKAIDAHLKRLRAAEAIQAAQAKAVSPDVAKAGTARVPAMHTMVKSAPKADPGVRFARVVKCLGMAQGNWVGAVEVAKQVYGERDPGIVNTIKANVTAGSTLTGSWAENLVGDETSAFADFVEFLRPMTILGRFGTAGIPSLRRIPFRVALVGQTNGGAGYWVGEGKPKPLTAMDFSRTTLEPLKVANIAVLTMEVLRDSSPSAELLVRDQLAAALGARMDSDFIDPAKSASAGVSPASILNGISAIPSGGNTADAIREDVRSVFAAFIAANNAPTSGVCVMSSTTALGLSMLVNALGQPEFPGITMMGGTFAGLPVITSEFMPTVSGGSYVALVNAQDIYIGDEGGLTVDMSTEASLQMLDNPTNDTVTPTATTMVSMFQTNSVAFRAERTINWARRRASAVAYLSAVNWGQA
ncbi:MAG: phage major capsid protein, partial [Bacteroidota bacterium]